MSLNNTYKIKAKSSLLNGGLVIETECSEKYLVEVSLTLLDKVRKINQEIAKEESLKAEQNRELLIKSLTNK